MPDAASSRILITGAAGFVGSKLAIRIHEQLPETKLFLADRNPPKLAIGHSFVVDIADGDSVNKLIIDTNPTTVLHLAARSAVATSFSAPRETWMVNTIGTLNVTLAVEKHAPLSHLIHVSTAEVYGRSAFDGEPVREDALLRPANPYAVAKAAADLLVQEATGRELFATIMRPFNHTGPGQTPTFAIPSFCRQIAAIEKGQQPPVILVGELDDERDFLDVDDVIDSYIAVARKGRLLDNCTILNIASGRTRRIGDILDFLLSASPVEIKIERDPSRLRTTRVPRIVGDASFARSIVGWMPTIPFERTLRCTLDYWRAAG